MGRGHLKEITCRIRLISFMAEMNVNEREGEEYMPGWLMTCRSKAAWDRAFREREMKLSDPGFV